MNTTFHTKPARPSVNPSASYRISGLTAHLLLLPALAGFLRPAASAQTLSAYQSVIQSQSPMSWFKFDNGQVDQALGTNATTGGTYGTFTNAIATNTATLTTYGASGTIANWTGGSAADVFHTPGKAVFFAGSADVLDVLPGSSATIINGGGTASDTSTNEGTICCLFRTLNAPVSGRRPIIWSGGDTGNSNALAMWIESQTAGSGTAADGTNDLKVRFGADTRTMLNATNILPSTWYYFALTYTEATTAPVDSTGTNLIKARWYLGRAGGSLDTGTIATVSNAVAGDGSHLVLGNVLPQYNVGFRGAGNGRVDEFVTWNRQLTSTEISNQFAALPQLPPPGANYQQVVASQAPKYYFKLDNSLVESVGGVLQLSPNGSGGTFTSDVLGDIDRAYSFSATNDALYITNDLINGGGPGVNTASTGVGTISFQFRMLSDTNYGGQRFIFSAPGEEDYGTNDNMLALYLENNSETNSSGTNISYPGSLKLRVGNLTKGSTGSSDPLNNIPVEYVTNLVPNAWYYFAMTYDEKRDTPEVFLYFGRAGGTLNTNLANPANAAVVGNNGWLCLGNKMELFTITNNAFRNPGQGGIDEFAIWHDELSPAELQAQFAAIAPAVSPSLTIVQAGGDVILSWPTSTPSSFVLESTNVLDATTIGAASWPSAGAPSVAGANYVITNPVSSDNRFYRLHKP
jgi:hypothetical protein